MLLSVLRRKCIQSQLCNPLKKWSSAHICPLSSLLLSRNHSTKVMAQYTLPNNTPVVAVDCEKAFNALTEKEKLYAHHLSKASWLGGLVVLNQVSLESSPIFCLLHKLFRSETIEELKAKALDRCGFTEDDFTALMVYTSGIFSDMGNYKGFGDEKFVPNLPKDKFLSLVSVSNAMTSDPKLVQSWLDRCIDRMYSLNDGEIQLGFPDVGVTTYFSKNCTKADSDIITEFMKKKNIEGWNSRIFKTIDEMGRTCYELRLASVALNNDPEECDLLQSYDEGGIRFVITRGDYSPLLKYVNSYLKQAKEYAANENEVKMVDSYINSFRTGSLEAHKTGSKFWVKDKNPIVETYIGFIENYRDPAGIRAEFEGFVAMVNKPMSEKFAQLVSKAEEILPLLPWPRTYEIDKFLCPEFVSLDILTFAGSGIPIGINIPNYEEIKQYFGFKNVSLGNVIQASYKLRDINYLSESDKAIMHKYAIGSLELIVGLHELLGHGTGKLFKKEKDGSLNFDPENVFDVETGEKITSWYNDGESYSSIFSSLSSAFEECRAESVAMYLSTVPDILKIFGYEGDEADDLLYTSWLIDSHGGIESLKTYNPATNLWLQAHSQAAFVMLRMLLESGNGFVTIEETVGEDGKPDLLLHVDRSKILTVGKPAMGEFLKKLQAYRSTADIGRAKTLFNKYSEVSNEGPYPFLKYREIVMARRKPRKMEVLPNTHIKDGATLLKNYEPSHPGIIQSWIDRFENAEDMEKALDELWCKDQEHFL